jgi:hypothetical protein
MNRKQFLVLIVLGLVIGGLGFYFANKRKESFSESSFRADEKVIAAFPINEVAHIRIRQGTNEVNLVRGEAWTVKERWDYPANFTEISDFLRKMWDLKPVQDVEVGESQYARMELVSPSDKQETATGTLVEFKDAKAANLKTIVLGKKHMKESPGGGMGMGGFPAGRYVLVPETKKVWLVNETFSNVGTDPAQWLNKDFFKVEKVKSAAVTSPNPTNTWTLSRESETGEWKMADVKEGENFDASKASTLNYALSSPSFNDVAAPDAKPEDTGFNQATMAKLETFDGFTYNVTIGGTNEDKVHLKMDVGANFAKERAPGKDEKPEDKEKLDKEFKEKNDKLQEKLKNEEKFEKWTYLVSKYTVDTLLKPRIDFMTEKKEEPKTEAAAPAESAVPPFQALPPDLTAPLPPPVPVVPENKVEPKAEATTEPEEPKN